MANAILNFHFDYWHTSLSLHLGTGSWDLGHISSLQMTTIVAEIMTEEITTEGTQTGEIIERIATTRGQGTS